MGDLALLTERVFPVREHAYDWRDSILYALGCGYGDRPDELGFVYEAGLLAVPTMACVLAGAGFWFADGGLTADMVVHSAEELLIHAPIPPQGVVIGRSRVVDVVDRGPRRGALVLCERTLTDKATGALLATVRETAFARADGGRGGTRAEPPAPPPLPDRPRDLEIAFQTLPQMAMIYRLSGDENPLHIDPEVARRAGFRRPILHGLASFAVFGRAVLHAVCAGDPARLRSLSCRFTRPVVPGDAIRVEIWQDGADISFRAWSNDRIVADQGSARIAPA